MNPDNFLGLLLTGESCRREVTEIFVKFVLTLVMSITAYSSTMHSRITDIGGFSVPEITPFVVNGNFAIVLAFFFLFWYVFYGFFPYIETVFAVRLVATVRAKISSNPQTTQGAMTEKQVRRIQKISQLLENFGFVTFSGNEYHVGPIPRKLAENVKRSWEREEDKLPFAPATSPFVTIHFLILYLIYLLPHFHLPFLLTMVFIAFALILIIIGWVSETLFVALRLYQHQFVEWVDRYTPQGEVA